MLQFLGINVLIRRIKALRYMMKDPEVPLRKKLLVVLGFVYICTPIDLVPIVIFPLGIIDDLVLFLWIMWHLGDELDKYQFGKDGVDLSKSYKGKDIIEDASYEVRDDEGPEGDMK